MSEEVLFVHKGYKQYESVVQASARLQQNLLRKGYYEKNLGSYGKAYKMLVWLQQCESTYISHGTWCPESTIVIEG